MSRLDSLVAALCSAKALSKYTDMVDGLIRQQLDKLNAASDDARLRLREWDLPDCLQVGWVCAHAVCARAYSCVCVCESAPQA